MAVLDMGQYVMSGMAVVLCFYEVHIITVLTVESNEKT